MLLLLKVLAAYLWMTPGYAKPIALDDFRWIGPRCDFALMMSDTVQNQCTARQVLCFLNGVNALDTGYEKSGCIASTISRKNMKYNPPIPIEYLRSPSEVMTDGFCSNESILTLFFMKISMIGNLPLLVAYRNFSSHPEEYRIRVVHDRIGATDKVQRYAAMFGLIVSR